MNTKKNLFYIFTLSVLIVLTLFSASALSSSQPVGELLRDNQGPILSIAYRGDTAEYPENSLEAVLSAKEKGADIVSVSVRKTKDGVFVLCEDETLGNVCNAPYESISEATFDEIKEYSLYDNCGTLTEYKMPSLEQLIDSTDENLYLILDIAWEDRDDVADLIWNKGALYRVALRVKTGAKKLAFWLSTRSSVPTVIGIYGGNIIWNTISHINTLSEAGMPAVQYQTKNYFNVCYGAWSYNNYSAENKARAVAATYNPDLCGQRTDDANGWNELIKKGFTVIETNNIEALEAYISKNADMRSALSELTEKAKNVDTEKYSTVSKENLAVAIRNAEAVLTGRTKSLAEAESAYSKLLFSLNEMKISTGEETTRGALNVTPGKLVAAVLVGIAILGGQILVQKMHVKKKK